MLTARTVPRLVLRWPLTVHQGWATFGVRQSPRLLSQVLIAPVRHYAQKPPGGMPGGPGGFPGLNMFGQQQEKGEALKQYVSELSSYCENFGRRVLTTGVFIIIRVLTSRKWREMAS